MPRSASSGGTLPKGRHGSPPGSPGGGRLSLETLRGLERKGQRAFARGEYGDAHRHTSKCIKALQAELASLLSLRAAIQLQQRDYTSAAADAENAMQLNKGWYKGHLRRGAILLAMNEPMEAAEHLETALQLQPQNTEVKRTLREAYKAISNNCYEQGHYEFAIRWCDHATEILKSENELPEEEFAQQLALCHSSRSAANMRQGNVREALRDAELAVFYNPWWVKGWLRKGQALAQLATAADIDAAVDALEEGLMIDPRSMDIRDALLTVRKDVAPLYAPFETSYRELTERQDGGLSDDSPPEDVPHFHEEWARYQSVLRLISHEALDVGVRVLYDSYLQARNIKLHLFSLETYDWTDETDAIWHRVGCTNRGMTWYRSSPRLGDVRDRNMEINHIPPATVKNRSFTHYPPMKLTLQVHRTVRLAMFHFTDLLVALLATVVYADAASVLEIIGYESNAYAIAKSAVIAQMLESEVPLEHIIQVWFSSGWLRETEFSFKQACLKLCQDAGGYEKDDPKQQKLPYEAKVIVQIWSGSATISRQTSLSQWREAHSKQDLGFLAANLRHTHDRVDYCHYFLTGELLGCDVGSITMFTNYSEIQSMVTSESLLQAIPLVNLHTAYNNDGTLFPTVVELLRRRMHVLRLRLKKKRLRFSFRTSPVPSDGTPLSDPSVAASLAEVKSMRATHFYWGCVLDRLTSSEMHDLVDRCGAKHCKNYAQTLQWNTATFGTHLLDYGREERTELIESLWKEAQQSIRAVGGSFLAEKPFAHPFHLCAWGLGRRYHKAWVQRLFDTVPSAVLHDTASSDFFPFSLSPLSLTWTPAPLGSKEASVVRSASPVASLRAIDVGLASDKGAHATTVQCHSCDQVVDLAEKHAHRHRGPNPGRTPDAERLDVMANVFGSGFLPGHEVVESELSFDSASKF
ncbi:Stress-induced-phosphoprotein 1 [Diplonema papillatum]|nr:Stress-induced-phosphoprotein 1 [Diplonema papillatum]